MAITGRAFGVNLHSKPSRYDLRNLRRGRKYYDHMPARKIVDRLGRKTFSDYYKFCFERNPWDKVVSYYYWKTVAQDPRIPFDKWLETARLPNEYERYSIDGDVAVDFIGRYEYLDNDLKLIINHLNLTDVPKLTKAKSGVRDSTKHYRDYYSPQTRNYVARKFAKEIELLGYDF